MYCDIYQPPYFETRGNGVSPLFPISFRIAVPLSVALAMSGCARLSETTRVVHDDDRVVVTFETDLNAPARTYTSPTDISTERLTSLLRGFSVRSQPYLPSRVFADDTPPKRLFRDGELEALAPVLHEALLKVGFRERVRFEVLSPGRNPRYWRDVTGGWIKVRDHYLHLGVDYFHVEQPVRKTDVYYRNYPTPWTPEHAYAVYFEPEQFYVTDPLLKRLAVDLDTFVGNGLR